MSRAAARTRSSRTTHFHLVYTLPGPIADIAYQNRAVIYDMMITIAADPKHLGARVGITSVLHTLGSAMTRHRHVHMIVPGGGLSEDGTRWIACRPNFPLAVRVLSRLFRRPVLQMLIAAHEAGRLQFFGATQRSLIPTHSPPSSSRSASATTGSWPTVAAPTTSPKHAPC
jgi:Putative transposase